MSEWIKTNFFEFNKKRGYYNLLREFFQKNRAYFLKDIDNNTILCNNYLFKRIKRTIKLIKPVFFN